MQKRVIYGESNYAALVREHGYFVDKTEYIAKLERVKNPVFLRPRRFGKSMFCSILRYYYDINQADHFAELFGQTWIGQQPTPEHNQYLVLFFNFSAISVDDELGGIERSFKNHCNSVLATLRVEYQNLLGEMPEMVETDPVSDNLTKLFNFIRGHQLPPVYVIIDELTSAFNIATFLTLVPAYEGMLGFTQPEVDRLLDAIYADYQFDPATRGEVNMVIKNNYDGYHYCPKSSSSR